MRSRSCRWPCQRNQNGHRLGTIARSIFQYVNARARAYLARLNGKRQCAGISFAQESICTERLMEIAIAGLIWTVFQRRTAFILHALESSPALTVSYTNASPKQNS